MNDAQPGSKGLSAHHLRIRYDAHLPAVIDGANLVIPRGKITALIGPNGSGKSTLVKSLARQLAPSAGHVLLDGKDIRTLSPTAFAARIGILFQENSAPADLTVQDLVTHGRYPHRRLFDALTAADEAAVEQALRLADLFPLRHRPLQQLSAGQRQLAWIAMSVAQGPDHLFLDEPTTYLDLAHQFDVMDLVCRLNREQDRTVVLVMHDLNLAASYAHHLCALKNGRIVAAGSPVEVLTTAMLREVFEVEAEILLDAAHQTPYCLPRKRS